MPTLILFAAWKNFGYNMILFLAGLQAIPRELYEAARIDGASAPRSFWHITLPMLGPTTLMVGILTLSGYFQLFAEPYVITEGGPLQSTVSVLYLMYNDGFQWWNLGVASAVAFVLFALIFAVTSGLLPWRGAGGWREARAWHALSSTAAWPGWRPVRCCRWPGCCRSRSCSRPPPTRLPPRVAARSIRRWPTTVRCSRRPAWAATSFNSLLVATLTTLVSLGFNLIAGYAFAKLRFAGRERIFHALVGALVMPAQVAMMPLFLLLKWMGLVNTYFGVMAPMLVTIFGIFLVRQYARSLPDELLEAARIDGAGEGRIFVRIVLPLLRPIIVTLAVFTFLASWNDFMWPLIILTGQEHYTLPVALAVLSREHAQDSEQMMAGAVVTMLPVLVLFLALQRHYIQGLLLGSLKG